MNILSADTILHDYIPLKKQAYTSKQTYISSLSTDELFVA